MIIKYANGENKLSLDDNNFPVMGGIDSTGEIRQVRTNPDGVILIKSSENVSATGALTCGQSKIAVTGTAIQLPSVNVGQFVVIKALSTNIANITVGVSGLTNTINGTGNGFILEPGDMLPIVVDNLNKIYINGTANDIVSYSLT